MLNSKSTQTKLVHSGYFRVCKETTLVPPFSLSKFRTLPELYSNYRNFYLPGTFLLILVGESCLTGNDCWSVFCPGVWMSKLFDSKQLLTLFGTSFKKGFRKSFPGSDRLKPEYLGIRLLCQPGWHSTITHNRKFGDTNTIKNTSLSFDYVMIYSFGI